MQTEAQKRAVANYRKRNVKYVTVPFYPTEKTLFEWLDNQGGRASYIKRLILEDYNRQN